MPPLGPTISWGGPDGKENGTLKEQGSTLIPGPVLFAGHGGDSEFSARLLVRAIQA